ncbi:hypothetical protein OEZ85_011010 [Tetradesmus obliquus]|uniref:TFIIS-type domain-containing protein n=1 Tax=Tetradesmus obliquus TaxID=3088 RepID=A0ABY8TNZ7_TETOB|nr:hypothetical protein OEZ85_011010 [Tetradesmus obliquus]
MAERRARVTAQLQRVFDGDSVLAHNLELAIFNHSIAHATLKGIPRQWQSSAFCACYSTKARSMLYNLRLPSNPRLRQQVMDGTISVRQLVKLSPQDMYPERWVSVLYDVARMANRRMAPQPGFGMGEGAFVCSRCKSKRTTYFQLQTRSADEPMTTFVTCLDCSKRWKISMYGKKSAALLSSTLAVDLGPSGMSPWGGSFADASARWLWSTAGAASNAGAGQYVRFQVTYRNTSGAAQTGSFNLCVDNRGWAFLNKTQIMDNFAGGSLAGGFSAPGIATVSLDVGTNIFDIIAYNWPQANANPAGLAFWMTVEGAIVLRSDNNTATPLANTSKTFVASSTAALPNIADPVCPFPIAAPLMACFSTRVAVDAYTGPVFRVRRDTDNATQDFFTDDTQQFMTTAAGNAGTTFDAWVGAAAAYVQTCIRTKRWKVAGTFCSWSCAKAFMLDRPNNQLASLLPLLRKQTTGQRLSDGIKAAPPRTALLMFGGHMSIDAFRADSGDLAACYQELPPNMLLDAPLLTLVPSFKPHCGLQAKPLNFDNLTPGTRNETLRLKRPKPVKGKANTNTNMLEKIFGIAT